MTVAADLAVRRSYTDQVRDLFVARPYDWIPAAELAAVGGFCGWRTRVSEARALVAADGFDIEWNGQSRASAYRLIAKPLGREAGGYVEQRLF